MVARVQIDQTRLMVSVDPGGEHVGVAMWSYEADLGGWGCDYAAEMNPEEFVLFLEAQFKAGGTATIVYESWQLYADKAQQQVGSDLEVVQLIGVIKYLASRAPVPWPGKKVQIFKQQAAIKTATRAVLQRKKVVSVAKRLGKDPDGHAFDAELHGYHFLGVHGLRTRYPNPEFPDPPKDAPKTW